MVETLLATPRGSFMLGNTSSLSTTRMVLAIQNERSTERQKSKMPPIVIDRLPIANVNLEMTSIFSMKGGSILNTARVPASQATKRMRLDSF